MKAILVKAPGEVEIIEKEMPQIQAPDDVLIKVMAAGICGSDVHVVHGSNPMAKYPMIPGHEIAARVEAVGEAVTDFKPGDRVVLEPIQYCGHCHACKRGRHNVCRSLKVRGATQEGGFQQYLVTPAKTLHHIPDNLTYEQAAVVEPYTIGEQANSRAGTRPDDVVLIYGAGPIGLIVLDVAKSIGATCIVSEVSASRREMAKEFGADYVLDPTSESVPDRLMEITDGMGPNVVFEATGVIPLFEEAVKVAASAGTVVCMAFNTKPAPLVMAEVVKKELNIVGTRLQYEKFEKAIAAMPQRLEHVKKLVTHEYPFEQFAEAVKLFEDKDSGACKIVLKF